MIEGDDATTAADSRTWDVFVLTMLAPLGGFPAVRTSPKLTHQDLGGVSRVAIPRGPGEFLVMVVVGDEKSPPVLLTNHRVIWFDRIESPPGSKLPSFAGRAAAFEDVLEAVPDSAGGTVDLGRGRMMAVPPNPPGLAPALANAIGTIAHAARTGEAPILDPETARRAEAAMPAIIAVDAELRDLAEDSSRFRRDLFTSAPTAYVTPTLIAACVLVYGTITAAGVHPFFTQNPADLLPWGANDTLRVALKGEWWRLPASVFLHGGGIHLAANMWALKSLGPLVERLYGSLRFASLYLAAGVGGAIASISLPPAKVGVGASGAIFGIIGGLLAFLVVHRRSVPPKILATLRSQTLTMIILNVAIGAAIPVIDQTAHLGGLATGFLFGLALAPAWPRPLPSAADRTRSAMLALLTAAVIVAVGAGVIRWRAGTITPSDFLRDYAVQVQPLQDRLYEFRRKQRDFLKLLLTPQEDQDAADRKVRDELPPLEREGRGNLEAIGRVWTAEPKLAGAVQLLDRAQREFDAALQATSRYVETRNDRWIQGEDGFVERIKAVARLETELRSAEEAYIREHGLEAMLEEVPEDEE